MEKTAIFKGVKTTRKEIEEKGWVLGADWPIQEKTIYIKFEGFQKGFKVGEFKKGFFKRISWESVKHLFYDENGNEI